MKRIFLLRLGIAAWALGTAQIGRAQAPAWWTARGVLARDMATNDYAPLNQGQLKHLAQQAMAEIDAHAPGGAGPEVSNLVVSFSQEDNYAPVTVGMLKNTALPFAQRLVEIGYATTLPWGGAQETNDYAPANVGQAKNLFGFLLDMDADGNTLPDWWEARYGLPSGIGMRTIQPAAWWKLDETDGLVVSNAISSNYCGTLVNWDADTARCDGRIGAALTWDGSNDYINVLQNPPIVTQGAFSVCAWVYDSGATQCANPALVSDTIYLDDDTWPGFCLRYERDANAMAFYTGRTNGTENCLRYAPWRTNQVARWTHVIVTHDTNDLTCLYLDGMRVAMTIMAFRASFNPVLWIGRERMDSTSSYWNGKMDDVRIYTTAITRPEIQRLFAAFWDPDRDGLINREEFAAGTDPHAADTDGDSLSDAEETSAGTCPFRKDTDGDGLADNEEAALGGNPLMADMAEQWEELRLSVKTYWDMVRREPLVFHHVPGSEGDRTELRDAMVAISTNFYRSYMHASLRRTAQP